MTDFAILTPDFAARFLTTLVAIALLLRLGYAATFRLSSSVFLFCVFGLGVFFMTYTMKFEEISLGFAFGLFAIFSMLRYRTELLGIRDMTYLFIVIVFALLGGVSPLSLVELPLMLALLAVAVVLVDSLLGRNRLAQQSLRYEKIDNIRPERRAQLMQDLLERTGLEIRDIRIDSIDFVQDAAQLTITYAVPAGKH